MDTALATWPATAAHRNPAAAQSPEGRDLLGRAAELDAVAAFLDDAAVRGGALVLTGADGVGTTALIDAAVARARRSGTAVLRTGGARAGVAFDALATLLRPIRHELHRLDPRRRAALAVAIGLTGGSAPNTVAVRTATLALLRARGEEQPLLVVVDDLEDLDHDSVTTLAFVARRLTGSRVGLLAATATGDGVALAGLAHRPVAPLAPAERSALRARRAARYAPSAAVRARSEELRLCATVLADPARVSSSDAASLDGVIRSLATEADPVRVTRVAALGLALDRVAECREPLRRVLDGARSGGAVPAAVTASALLCAGDVATGRWDEADRLAAEGAELCAQHGHRLGAAPLHLAEALVAAARGDEVRTRALVDAAAGRAAPREVPAVASGSRRVLAFCALGHGDAENAYRHATAVTPPGRLVAGVAAVRVSLDLVEAAVRLGRRDEADRHVQAMREAPLHGVSPRFAMLTAAAAALAAEPGAAQALFAEALDTPDADRWPFDQARIRLAQGEHLRRQRRVGPARASLGAALDTFLRLGARPWAAQAQHGLRATGLTVGRPVDAGAAGLTADERTVAALAAAGLTNKQIARRLRVSPHTVAARLYQVFPKLGVGSRAALRLALPDDDGDGDGGGRRWVVSG